MSSMLLNFPGPLVTPTCPEDADVLCEFESRLLYGHAHAQHLPPFLQQRILDPLPRVTPPPTMDDSAANSHPLLDQSGSLAARMAFLPPRPGSMDKDDANMDVDDEVKAESLLVKAYRALTPWQAAKALRAALSSGYDQGLLSALESLVSTSSYAPHSSEESRLHSLTSPNKPQSLNLCSKLLEFAARVMLGGYRATSNIYSARNPHLTLSGEELIRQFSETRDWPSCRVRALAWHPHTDKFAIAFKDDTIQVHGRQLSTSPLLKYRQQRGVTCLAWRPLNASELAVGCKNGLLIWTVEPTSVATRPSASCIQRLAGAPGHMPVTSIQWDPNGKFLLSASAADHSMYLWTPSSDSRGTALRRIAGGGVSLVSWSPSVGAGARVLAGTTSTAFRIWDARTWQNERWDVMQGHVQTACWSPCGRLLLFATSHESLIYSVTFTQDGSASAAVAVADLSEVQVGGGGGGEGSLGGGGDFANDDDEEPVILGGSIQCLRWDPLGERLAVSFQHTDSIALLATCVQPAALSLTLTPIGLVRGVQGEQPSCMDFARKFDDGALLTVAWSSGRLQYIPLLFVPNIQEQRLLLNPDWDGAAAAATNRSFQDTQDQPVLFTTPQRII